MEILELSSRDMSILSTDQAVTYPSSTFSDSTTNKEKEHVTQLLSDLTIYHGENLVGPLEEQELHKPPKGSSEDELLLLIENFRHLEECLEGTVEKLKVIFPSSDSEYVDAWEVTCRGIKRLQEGLSMISDAKRMVCPPIVNHYPQDY